MSEPSLWQTAIVEFAATGFGVLAALGLENWWSGRNFKKRLDEIAPYIYMELAENLLFIRRVRGNFITNYWESFRTELSKWNEEQIVKIIRIYNFMEAEQSPELVTTVQNNQIENLIVDTIKWVDSKAEADPDFRKKLEKVDSYFEEMRKTIQKKERTAPYRPKYYVAGG